MRTVDDEQEAAELFPIVPIVLENQATSLLHRFELQ